MKIQVIKNILEESDSLARANRAILDTHGIFMVNIMSSPGAGKTALISETISRLQAAGNRCAVIEGDITSTIDSERLVHLNIPIVQANTEPFGGDCHVGSHLIRAALEMLPLPELDFIIVENIGNLVCPAEFYIGENVKVVVLSLPEGEDKPLKYPLMFRQSDICLVSKVDLESFMDVNVSSMTSNIRKVNGTLEILQVSSKTGEGLKEWCDWLAWKRTDSLKPQAAEVPN